MHIRRTSVIGIVVALSAAGGVSSALVPSPAGGTVARPAPAVHLVVPPSASVGSVVQLQVVATGAPTLAAFEGALRYDDRAVDISRVVWAPTMPAGAALHGLESNDNADRTSLGAWSCTGSGCAPSRTPSGGRLAEIDVVVLRAGTVHLRLDGIEMTGSDGAVIASSNGRGARLTPVDVTLRAGRGPAWPAPAGAATHSSGRTPHESIAALAGGAAPRRDALGLAAAWMTGATRGDECAADSRATSTATVA